MKIFVYGTLKRGHNDKFMEGAEAVLEGKTKEDTLLMESGHPFCIPKVFTKGYSFKESLLGYTKGEIVIYPKEVPKVISYLDCYEGAPEYFRREKIIVQELTNDDRVEFHECTTYVPSDHTIRSLLDGHSWASFINPDEDQILEWR